MTRVLKRPMFRIGGSTNEGITSGLAPRQGYETGKTVEDYKRILGEAAGRRPDRSLSNFLIDFGLNVAGATPSGSIFSTAAKSAQEPFQRYQASKADRAAFDQKLGLSAATMALEHEQAQKLKMMGDKTSMGTLRKNARDIVNSGIINPATDKPYTDSEAFQYAIELAETSPGKSKQDSWLITYNKEDPNLVDQHVRENRADWTVYIRPNIPISLYGGPVPTYPEGTGTKTKDIVDVEGMEPNKVYWDEVSGKLWEVDSDHYNETGEKIAREVPGWRDKYYKR